MLRKQKRNKLPTTTTTTDFEDIECCLSVAVQRALQKNNGRIKGVPRVTETLGKPNSHFEIIKRGLGPHHHVEAAVYWCKTVELGKINTYIQKSLQHRHKV